MRFTDSTLCGARGGPWARAFVVYAALSVVLGNVQAAYAQSTEGDHLAGYERLDQIERDRLEGSAPLEALSRFVRWPEELHEGATLSVVMRPAGDHLIADIEVRGYLDDSVSGENFRAILEEAEEARWLIKDVGRQRICARGSQAGMPTTERCP